MIIYRPHRELLEDAMAEAKEFETVDDMKRYIVQSFTDEGWGELVSFDDISIDTKRCVKDDRIGWNDTRYVIANRFGNEKGSICIGMCATDYIRKKEGRT